MCPLPFIYIEAELEYKVRGIDYWLYWLWSDSLISSWGHTIEKGFDFLCLQVQCFAKFFTYIVAELEYTVKDIDYWLKRVAELLHWGIQ